MDRSRGQRRPQSHRTNSERATQHRPQHVPGPYPPRQSDDVNTCSRSTASQSSISQAGWSTYSTSGTLGRPIVGQGEPFSFTEDTQSRSTQVCHSVPPCRLGCTDHFDSQPRIDQLVRALETHQINTVGDLRRVEKASITINDPTLRNAMASAWVYYVNSNNLLSELRALTEQYAFSSELLDEAKYLALSDGASTQSRNFCLLVLKKIRDE